MERVTYHSPETGFCVLKVNVAGLVVIIGQPRALEMAVRNRKANRRVTKLRERLKELH